MGPKITRFQTQFFLHISRDRRHISYIYKCKAHSKVTHIKQQKLFHHLKRPGYNTEFLLYPRPFRWWKYFCCFICVTLLWALNIVIKQQFFYIYICSFSTFFYFTRIFFAKCCRPFLQTGSKFVWLAVHIVCRPTIVSKLPVYSCSTPAKTQPFT